MRNAFLAKGAPMRGLIVTLLLLGSTATAGAGGPPLEWADGTEVTIEQVREEKLKRKEAWQDCWAWAAYEGFQPLKKPVKGAPPSGAPGLPFLKRVNRLYYW